MAELEALNSARNGRPARKCAECATSFVPGRDHARFCQTSCGKAFHNRHLSQGGPLTVIVKAAVATRHAKAGTREAAINTFARREMTAMCREFLEADREANGGLGRDIVAYVGDLMDSGILYCDRARR